MNNKLALIISFVGIDKMSGALRNIAGLGQRGSTSLRGLAAQSRNFQRELRGVQRELAKGTGNVTELVNRERQLERALAASNRQLERQKRLAVIDARTAGLAARGSAMVSEGKSGLLMASMAAAPIFAIAKASGEVDALNRRLRTLGLGDAAIRDLNAYAGAMNVAGSSVKDNLRYLLEAQGVFRETGAHNLAEQLVGAKLMGPLLAKMNVAAKAMHQEIGEEQERYFLRFIEQAGGLNDPRRAAQLSDGLFRALQSSGGNVQASNYQSFLARAGIAGAHLSNRAMFADFEPLIAELHDQAGVGLSTAFKRASGITANSRAASEFLRLGLWDRNKVVFNSLGGVKSTKGNPLDANAAALMARDPVEFYRQRILPAYQKAGINTSEARSFENARLFGGTGGNLFNLIDKQMATIMHSRGAFVKTQGLNQAYAQTSEGFFGQQGKLRAAGMDFMVAAGSKGGLLDQVVFGMRAATSALKALTALGNAHPTAFRWIATAATGLIGLRMGLSVARIGFGYLLGPAAQLWGIWSRYRALGSIAAVFPRFSGAIMLLARVALRAGLMLLGNPILAAAAAIGLAAYLIWSHWGRIKAAFANGWAAVKAVMSGAAGWMSDIGHRMMQGLLLALNPALLAQKLLQVARSGIVAFKNFFGIKSPSRLFMAMGGYITDGLAIGIERGHDAPTRAAGRMAARTAAAGTVPSLFMALGNGIDRGRSTPMRATQPIPARTGAAGSAAFSPIRPARSRGSAPATAPSGPITIHVHGAPGQSARELAREVMREIQQVQKIQARSSYGEAA